MESDDLFLHEALLMLALRDEKGTIEMGVDYPHALGGAILAEFVLNGRVTIDTTKRSKKVHLLDATPFGDPVLDDCLAHIRDRKKPDSAKNWVMHFANAKGLKHRVAERLVGRGILRMEEDRILHLFKRKKYPEVNHEPERRLIAQMREVIFGETPGEDPRILVLVALARVSDILKHVIDKKELKTAKDRLKAIEKGELVGQATREAVEAMQAAVAVTVAISASVAATTAATS